MNGVVSEVVVVKETRRQEDLSGLRASPAAVREASTADNPRHVNATSSYLYRRNYIVENTKCPSVDAETTMNRRSQYLSTK